MTLGAKGDTNAEEQQQQPPQLTLARWGGLAGMLSGIIFTLTFVILAVFVPPTSSDPAGLVMRFSDVKVAVTVGQSLYFVAVVLLVALFLALYRSLRRTSLTPALFGSVLGIIGQVVLAAGAMPVVAFAPISDLYHAPEATPGAQETLLLMSRVTQGIFNELDTMGFLVMTIGFIILGVAMLRAPAFGKTFGAVTMILGAAGIVGITIFAINSPSIAPFTIVVFIVLPILLGWKLYRLSKTA